MASKAHRMQVVDEGVDEAPVAQDMAQDAPPPVAETLSRTLKDGTVLALPARFHDGYRLNAAEAAAFSLTYARSYEAYANSQAAARAKRYAAAKTVEDAEANLPLTVAQHVEAFRSYVPAIGTRDGTAGVDDLRNSVAWKFGCDLIMRHNAAIARAGTPVIREVGNRVVTPIVIPRKVDGVDEAEFTAKHAAAVAAKAKFIEKLLAHPTYGPQIETLIEAKLAERKAVRKAEKKPDDNAVSSDNIF